MMRKSSSRGKLCPLHAFFVVTSATERARRENVSAGVKRPMLPTQGGERHNSQLPVSDRGEAQLRCTSGP